MTLNELEDKIISTTERTITENNIQNIIQNANIYFIDIMLITKQILSRQSYND